MDSSAQTGEAVHPQCLEPSELGTKEYWETFYKRSLEHIASKKTDALPLDAYRPSSTTAAKADEEEEENNDDDDDDDPGTSWFSEHNAPQKVLEFLTSRKFPLSPRNKNTYSKKRDQPRILDLGTGNGSMLALLRKKGGYKGQMVGVDYSAQSVQLARELQRLKLHSAYESDEEKEKEEKVGEHEDVVTANNAGSVEAIPVDEQDIKFEEWDILDPTNEDALAQRNNKKIPWFPYHRNGFDIVLDKGTFDAVSLSDATVDNPATATATATSSSSNSADQAKKEGKVMQQRICNKYPLIAAKLVRPGGFLVVTSCNWTEDELVRWFTATGELDVWDRVEYPRFRFGGHEGQGVCTVCFKRVDS